MSALEIEHFPSPTPCAPQACTQCGAGFSLLRMGHCCRRCARVFCSGCARVKRGPAARGAPSRVCRECVAVVGSPVRILLDWAGWSGTEHAGYLLVLEFNRSLPGEDGGVDVGEGGGDGGGVAARLLQTVRAVDPALPRVDNPARYLLGLADFLSDPRHCEEAASATPADRVASDLS